VNVSHHPADASVGAMWFDRSLMRSAKPSTSGARGWSPGNRMARRRASHSYGIVLLLIVASFLFTATGPDEGTWGQGVLVLLQSATLVAALWTSGLGRAAVLPSVLLAGLGVAVASVQIVRGGDGLTGAAGILNALLVVAIAVVIAVGVFDQQTVNEQSILGAICIYVLIGMMFTFAYGAVAVLGSGDLFAQGTDGTPSLRLYFSYVTLATLGYGDYTPVGDLGHTLAIIEALLGQLYLVTVVAVIVGRLHSERPSRS
jgi:voltage-gated potassium channel